MASTAVARRGAQAMWRLHVTLLCIVKIMHRRNMYMYMYTHLPVRPSVRPSVRPPVHPSVHPPARPPVRTYVRTYILKIIWARTWLTGAKLGHIEANKNPQGRCYAP